jgi:hypothetical protein
MSRYGVQVLGFRQHCPPLRLLESDSANVLSIRALVAFTHDRSFHVIGTGRWPLTGMGAVTSSSRAGSYSPYPPGDMCYLQETTFSCGSVYRSLFMSCKYADRLTRTTDGCAPRFCLRGFKVVKNIAVDEPCGSSNGGGCLQAKTAPQPQIDHRRRIRKLR